MEEKKNYMEPEAELISVEGSEDVVCSSGAENDLFPEGNAGGSNN